jgi:hypothetical protein
MFFLIVLDSWGKLPPGLFGGNYFWLGAYWECKKIDPSIARSCTIANTGANLVVHNAFKIPVLLKYFNSTNVPVPFALATVCVPASCDSDNFLPSVLELLNQDQIPVQLVEFSSMNRNLISVYCEKDADSDQLSAGAVFTIGILTLLAIIGIVCSIVDQVFLSSRLDVS